MGSSFQNPLLKEQDITEAIRRAEILQRVMASINSSLTLEPLLSHILYSTVTLIQATYGTIGLVVERNDGSTIRTVAVYNLPNGELDAEMRYGIRRVATTRWKHSMNNAGWNR